MTNKLPVWDLNDYLLSNTTIAGLLGYSVTGSSYSPFWPVQEEPESEPPFIRYTSSTSFDREQWWTGVDLITYAVYDSDVTNTAAIAMQIANIARQGEGAATLVNNWMATEGRTDFRFLSLSLNTIVDGDPASEEAGIRPRIVVLTLKFVINEGLGQLD